MEQATVLAMAMAVVVVVIVASAHSESTAVPRLRREELGGLDTGFRDAPLFRTGLLLLSAPVLVFPLMIVVIVF